MKFFWRGLFLLSMIIMFFACKEDDSILGENFLDSKLSIDYDTIYNLTTLSEGYDYTDTVLSGVSVALIGDYYDEVFGDHQAITAFDVAPMFNEIDSTGNRQADSLILQLDYRGNYYGYDTTDLTFNLYKVEQPLNQIDSSVLGNVELTDYYDQFTPIATATYGPGIDSASRFLKFTLPQSIADDLLENIDMIITSNQTFIDYFNGFIITAERQGGGTGSLVQFNLTSEETHLRLHYSDSEFDEQVFYFYPVSSDVVTSRFNFFDHDYSTGTISNQMISTDPVEFNPNGTFAYLQAVRGINLKIDVDLSESEIFSDELNVEDLVINRVMLSLEPIKKEIYLPDDTLQYAPPSSISIMEFINGETEHIIDYLVEPGLSAPEYYDEDNDSYDFVFSGLTHEKLVEGKTSFTLWMRASRPSVTANRAVFYGSGAVDSLKPKVVITYSKRTNN